MSALPVRLRLLLCGDAVSAIGIGLTQPYLVILLHTGKGVPLATAAAMTSLPALASFPGNWLSGALADRVGGHRAMTAGLVATIGGLALVATAGHPVLLGVAVAAVGFGWSVALPAYSALIAALVPEEARSRAFTLQYALFNAGMGAGAAVGAVVGVTGTLWWVAAATCGVAVACVWAARSPAPPPDAPAPRSGGYRAVARDRALLRVLLVAALTAAAGYGVYNAGLPVVAVRSGDPGLMPWASVVNCLVIVAGLPVALRAAERLRPPQLVAVAATVWSAGWLLCVVLRGWVALPLAAGLMGIGELFLSGALPSMVNALAPDALRGRYNAALTVAMTSGMWAGPLLAAAATALDRVWLLFALAVALLAVASRVALSGTRRTRCPAGR
ncbi:MFS transporter [Dactylosporangium sp. NPDC005572]|uniref:MFS transporter n=1 Tax=Dactylosporangium sp. NPDC005572 TaxID=3156889 RepID=UPI0033BB56CC